ncbi:hypothetical protein Y032_0073g734 [Ancylostoma ceylanicum]|uniref:Uncharacterized protein n=2 Tax=Ancylostoma ceylanicum TaxID=53326 RepID=A0A016TVK2_9BILA|nr:hypothetical protein Y032_0073g734 [Ancylostoma ceylanicum]
MKKSIKWIILALLVIGILAVAGGVLAFVLTRKNESETPTTPRTSTHILSTEAPQPPTPSEEIPTTGAASTISSSRTFQPPTPSRELPTTTRTAPPISSTRTRQPTTTSKGPQEHEPRCLFVGDLYNFGNNEEAYKKEADLMDAVGCGYLKISSHASAGLWAYGYANFSRDPSTSLENMRKSCGDFKQDLVNFNHFNISDPVTTGKAIQSINEMHDHQNRINCLVFFSAVENIQGLPKMNPLHLVLDRIVAVGLNGVDLNELITTEAIALSIPYSFTDDHVKLIVDAIMGRYKPRSTIEPTTNPPPPLKPRDCLFVGDLFNFGDDEESYQQEGEFLSDVAFKLFGEVQGSSIALWAYGYTIFPKSANTSLEKMSKNYYEFYEEFENMVYYRTADPLSTSRAIEEINTMYDSEKRADCLVFFSAQKNTQELPKINPQHWQLDRVVAVGFNDTDLSGIVPSNGVAVSVPFSYKGKHISDVVYAIAKESKPTESPETSTGTFSTRQSSTRRVRTTKPAPPGDEPRCLFVGDLFNFGSDEETYETEGNFIADVGYALIKASPISTVGFWAYGYTKMSKSPSTALYNMSSEYSDFILALENMEYVYVADPLTTSTAIEAINEIEDAANRANCLIFLSAQQNPQGLPQLNPKYAKLERIVAVGFNDTDLSNVIPENGKSVSVPIDYADAHVTAVLNAIIGKSTKRTTTAKTKTTPKKRSTKPRTSTTPVPDKNEPHCVFAGDLLNFGNDTDFYEKEKQFIIDIGTSIFEKASSTKAGMWVYGYTSGPRGLKSTFENMTRNVDDFVEDVNKKMKYEALEKPNLTNKQTIANLNNASDKNRNANCLVLFSGIEDTTGFSKLNLTKNAKLDRVVVVSLRGLDLSDIVVEPKGVAIKVSNDFTDEDVAHVVETIWSAFKPTSKIIATL